MEINNFYTATVYEKGAEVIGMLKRLVGDDGYRKALDLYFERHDGQAATIEDWLKVFEDATGRDLTQFKRWYTDAGTPRLTVTEDWNDGTYTLHFEQETAADPGPAATSPPRVIPIAVGLLNPNGDEVRADHGPRDDRGRARASPSRGSPPSPIPSILRGFSAPVILERATSAEERAFLLAHDTDPFNRWEAGRGLAKDVLARMITDGAAPGPAYLDALARAWSATTRLDPAFRALALRLPSEDDMAQTLPRRRRDPGPRPRSTPRAKPLLGAVAAPPRAAAARALRRRWRSPAPTAPDAARRRQARAAPRRRWLPAHAGSTAARAPRRSSPRPTT